jgi:hypothetical protein
VWRLKIVGEYGLTGNKSINTNAASLLLLKRKLEAYATSDRGAISDYPKRLIAERSATIQRKNGSENLPPLVPDAFA